MFIYKIVVDGQVYIGLDTKPAYKNFRWKHHCRESQRDNPKLKLHKEMKKSSIENCTYEIIEQGFTSISNLAVAEINYIKKYNTYKNGLNSSEGGDGLGIHDLKNISEEDLKKIKESLGNSLRNYNVNYKWANTSELERKILTSHLHNSEIYRKKSETLKKFYQNNPEAKFKKGEKIKKWQQENLDKVKETNKINGLKGSRKVSKRLLVTTKDGDSFTCNSKSEFNRITKQWANTVIKKTNEGYFHNGYKAREI